MVAFCFYYRTVLHGICYNYYLHIIFDIAPMPPAALVLSTNDSHLTEALSVISAERYEIALRTFESSSIMPPNCKEHFFPNPHTEVSTCCVICNKLSSKIRYTPSNLNSLSGVFVAMTLGYVLACEAFVIELLWNKCFANTERNLQSKHIRFSLDVLCEPEVRHLL